MPLKFEDAATQIAGLKTRGESMHALFDLVVNAVRGITSPKDVTSVADDIDAHRGDLINAVETGLPGTAANLGAGETPNIPHDDVLRAHGLVDEHGNRVHHAQQDQDPVEKPLHDDMTGLESDQANYGIIDEQQVQEQPVDQNNGPVG